MFSLYSLFFPWSLILQAIAIVHFIRRRPDTYWLWIIIVGGGLGALVYIAAEMVPDLGLLRGTFQVFGRRKRINELEALVHDNPSAGNLEELGGLYLDDLKYARARECFNRAISSRTDSPDPFYRRALCALELGDYPAALTDLERVTAKDPRYDFSRAQGLLAHAYAMSGNAALAEAAFRRATENSTLSETQFHYAEFLRSQGRIPEAREWAQRVMQKKASLPSFLKRRERPWFRKASALLKQMPKT